MHRFSVFIRHYGYHLLLTAIVLLLFITNYEKNTVLTGWDNLQTELYPSLAIKRAFFSVWQEYQSFGLVSGLAHSSDLIRAIFMWLLSFILPQAMQRYFFHLFMLLVGSFGMFRLLEALGFDQKKRIFAFTGAVLYMLNIGTIQMFALPLEAFSIFFAMLPWQLWIYLEVVHYKKPRWLLFFIINLLATPAYYIQTIFIVYMLTLAVFTVGLLFSKAFLSVLWRGILAAIIIIALNLFWLLPQFYFLKNSNNVVQQAKSNTISTDDLFYQNQEKGTLQNFAKLEGFYLDMYSPNENFLFQSWKDHFKQPGIFYLQLSIILIAIVGILRFTPFTLSFLLSLAIMAIALMPSTSPFSLINEFLRSNDTLNQIFRAPFTKFIIPYVVILSFFFTNGLLCLSHIIASVPSLVKKLKHKNFTHLPHKLTHNYLISSIVCGITCICIFIYALPAFTGNFYNPAMRVQPPASYQKMMSFFRTVDVHQRIALFPDYTFWGWFFTRWGYNGSGFLWYGIEQPIVSRTFDVWSDKSESYFWEIKAAIEAEDSVRVQKILEKYNISYLVVDDSLLPVSASIKSLQFDRLQSTLAGSPSLRKLHTWDNLTVYEVNHSKPIKNYVTIASNLPNIGPAIRLTNDDNAYQVHGDYVTNPATPYSFFYPLLDMMTQTPRPDKKWSVKLSGKTMTVTSPIDASILKNLDNYTLESATKTAKLTVLDKKGKEINISNSFKSSIEKTGLKTTFTPYLVRAYSYADAVLIPCGKFIGNQNITVVNSVVTLSAEKGGTNCLQLTAPDIEQRYGYIADIKTDNVVGRSLYFYTLDRTKNQTFIEDRLHEDNSLYILNPKFANGIGYNFTFQNNSYSNAAGVNKWYGMSLYHFPYQDLKNIVFRNKKLPPVLTEFEEPTVVTEKNYYTYQVTLPTIINGDNKTIILYQGYEQGWGAYASITDVFTGKKLGTHLMVNNWANGWQLDSSMSGKTIVLIFWPQYLQYAGLIVLLLLGIILGTVHYRRIKK